MEIVKELTNNLNIAPLFGFSNTVKTGNLKISPLFGFSNTVKTGNLKISPLFGFSNIVETGNLNISPLFGFSNIVETGNLNVKQQLIIKHNNTTYNNILATLNFEPIILIEYLDWRGRMKYLVYENGRLKEKRAVVQSTGPADAGKIVALGSDGRLDMSVLPTGIGRESKLIVASENLSAGDFVNVWDDNGVLKVRKADAATNKPAHGFVLASATVGGSVEVLFEGINTQLTGLVPGQLYYLSATTPGKITATPPTQAGHIVQVVGWAIGTTELSFEPETPIELA